MFQPVLRMKCLLVKLCMRLKYLIPKRRFRPISLDAWCINTDYCMQIKYKSLDYFVLHHVLSMIPSIKNGIKGLRKSYIKRSNFPYLMLVKWLNKY